MSFTRAARPAAATLFVLACAACAAAPRERAAPTPPAAVQALPADSSRVYPFEELQTRPLLRNRAVVATALSRNYPPDLRDQRIGGETQVFLVIDENGAPRGLRVVRSSGYPALDEAAVRVIGTMRFSPPLRQGQRVRTSTVLPVSFTPGG